MAQVTFNIPDEHLQKFALGLSHDFGYRETLPDGTPNTETRAQFAKRKWAADGRRRAIRGWRAIQIEAIETPEIDVTL